MIANTPCHGVTIVRWIFIFGIIAFAVPIIMETLRNLWLNWGWSHPYLSTFFVMIVAGLAWWGFGGLMYLSTPREKVPSLKEPVVSIQEPLPLAPIATPDFSDPAYDQFF